MAVIKQKIYRKNASRIYDTIHFITGSDCVLRANGTTVEQTLVLFEQNGLQGYFVGAAAPSNTKLLWIDTNSSTGGLKYHNGSAWVHVPVAYTS